MSLPTCLPLRISQKQSYHVLSQTKETCSRPPVQREQQRQRLLAQVKGARNWTPGRHANLEYYVRPMVSDRPAATSFSACHPVPKEKISICPSTKSSGSGKERTVLREHAAGCLPATISEASRPAT